ncbi:hypothetical protein MCOR25_001034 [Pyricularia grisea]|nr:hypothetical protein MCOR25_001034 [Pyricularia grisea]
MPKEKNYNPVQAQRKADKAKEIKKGKAEVQARRNERLAKRNPEGIKRQIDDLKAVAEGGGKLSSHEESVLEGLEKELKAVLKARELLGDKAPQFGSSSSGRPHRDGGRDDRGSLGKRRRGEDDPLRRDSDSDSDEVPEDVARIPMPRDTPPPIPKEVLDRWWAKRRAKRGGGNNNSNNANTDAGAGAGSSANAVPLTKDRGLGRGSNSDTGLPPKPAPVATTEPKVVYESKPVVRDLRKEAVSAFVPSVVQAKLSKGKGEGGTLLEPEEADRLEQEGYLKATGTASSQTGGASKESENAVPDETNRAPHQVMMEEVDDEEG